MQNFKAADIDMYLNVKSKRRCAEYQSCRYGLEHMDLQKNILRKKFVRIRQEF